MARVMSSKPPPTTARSDRQQTTRVTRSQTRSVSAEPMPHTFAKATTATQLQTVQEDATAESLNELDPGIIDDVVGDEEPQEPEQVESDDESSGSIAPSAMTSQTTFSQDELQNMEPKLILGFLSDLRNHAHGLLTFIAPLHTDLKAKLNAINDTESAESKLLRKRVASLASIQDGTFGSQNLIRPDLILRALLDIRVPQALNAQWRPDAIIYQANLATVVAEMCTMSFEDPDATEVLASLDSSFPAALVSGFVGDAEAFFPGSSTLLDATADLALEIRTQLAIVNLHAQYPESDDEAISLLHQIFAASDDEDVDRLDIELDARGWDGIPLDQDDLAQVIRRRLRTLSQPFNSSEIAVAMQEVQDLFPWTEFQLRMLEWSRLRKSELDQQLDRQGGTESVVVALEQEAEYRKENPDAPLRAGHESEQPAKLPMKVAPRLSSAPPSAISGLGKKSWTGGGLHFLKKKTAQSLINPASSGGPGYSKPREVQHADTRTTTPFSSAIVDDLGRTAERSSEAAAPVVAEDIDDFQDIDDVVEDEEEQQQEQQQPVEPPMSPMKRKVEAIHAREARENKENQTRARPKKSLLDTQANGQRITFDEDDAFSQDLPQRAVFRLPRNLQPDTVKRTLPPDVEDPSEDEGFQVDTREPPTKRPRTIPRRQTIPRATPPAVIGSSRPPIIAPPPASASPPHGAKQTTSSRRKNPGQLIEPFVPRHDPMDPDAQPLRLVEQWEVANQAAKSKRVAKMRSPQKARVPWSTEECQALLELIVEHGPSYSSLKKMDMAGDNVLEGRTSEDMRFKARNMKYDFLKGGMALPDNFDSIQLDMKARAKLASEGIAYDHVQVRDRH